MTTEQPHTTIRKQDVEDVAAKLEAFMATLPEDEQNVLGLVLTRAANASEADVDGYYQPTLITSMRTPLSSQLAYSSGIVRAGQVMGTCTFGWGFKSKMPGGLGGTVSNPGFHV